MGLILYILSMVENDPITDSVMNFPIFKYHPRKRLVDINDKMVAFVSFVILDASFEYIEVHQSSKWGPIFIISVFIWLAKK